jgi:protein tyrosine phosphatase
MFIAAQGPLKSTTKNFWNTILNKKIKLIIMLTDSIENGRVK